MRTSTDGLNFTLRAQFLSVGTLRQLQGLSSSVKRKVSPIIVSARTRIGVIDLRRTPLFRILGIDASCTLLPNSFKILRSVKIIRYPCPPHQVVLSLIHRPARWIVPVCSIVFAIPSQTRFSISRSRCPLNEHHSQQLLPPSVSAYKMDIDTCPKQSRAALQSNQPLQYQSPLGVYGSRGSMIHRRLYQQPPTQQCPAYEMAS